MATIHLRIQVDLPDDRFAADSPDLAAAATDILAGKVRELGQHTVATAVRGVVLAHDMRKLGNASIHDGELKVMTVGEEWGKTPSFAIPRPPGMPLDQAEPDPLYVQQCNQDWLAALEVALRQRGYDPVIRIGGEGFNIKFLGREAPPEMLQECMRQAGRMCGFTEA